MEITALVEKALADGPVFVVAVLALLVAWKALSIASKEKNK